MQNVKRNGVDIDICPTCRGVWLDRGELEKLMEGARGEVGHLEADRQKLEREIEHLHRDPEDWKRRHPYDAQHKRYRYDDDYHYRKKKKHFDIFDIFD
jgi:Zn-finger nucleic acid-binding protein